MPMIYGVCFVEGCFKRQAPVGRYCKKHSRYHKIGNVLVYIAAFLGAFAVIAFPGCASPGPSRERLQVLLHQCREANRERARVIHDYEALPSSDVTHPEQTFDSVNFSEAGH